MRSVGSAQDAGGLGVHDHVSWPYDDRAEFCARVREFLSDGMALGLRCVYAADRSREALRADLAGIADLDVAIDRGALVLNVLGDIYAKDAAIDPDETLATFAASLDDALSAGFRGLRIAADSTPLVRTPEQLAAFAAWEHQADRFMTEQPFSGLCGFDRAQLPPASATALACLHPVAREGTTSFRVFASDSGADLAVAGELDVSVSAELRNCLDRIPVDTTCELVVDGTKLDFLDHRALESIRDFAQRRGVTAVVRSRSAVPERLVDLLQMQGIRAERVVTSGASV